MSCSTLAHPADGLTPEERIERHWEALVQRDCLFVRMLLNRGNTLLSIHCGSSGHVPTGSRGDSKNPADAPLGRWRRGQVSVMRPRVSGWSEVPRIIPPPSTCLAQRPHSLLVYRRTTSPRLSRSRRRMPAVFRRASRSHARHSRRQPGPRNISECHAPLSTPSPTAGPPWHCRPVMSRKLASPPSGALWQPRRHHWHRCRGTWRTVCTLRDAVVARSRFAGRPPEPTHGNSPLASIGRFVGIGRLTREPVRPSAECRGLVRVCVVSFFLSASIASWHCTAWFPLYRLATTPIPVSCATAGSGRPRQ